MNKFTFDESSIDRLKRDVASRMSEYRFNHTLGVEKMAISLGEIFMPDNISELRVAALLHDVSKEMDIDEQLCLLDNCERIDKKQKCVPAALHSFSAVAVILRDFPNLATNNILDAVENHTLGSPNMSLFSEIIFISDYIEDGRAYFESASVRKTLFEKIKQSKTQGDRIKALHFATVLSISNTLKDLQKRGLVPDERSLKTKIAFEALI